MSSLAPALSLVWLLLTLFFVWAEPDSVLTRLAVTAALVLLLLDQLDALLASWEHP